jgi:hypothetical protein
MLQTFKKRLDHKLSGRSLTKGLKEVTQTFEGTDKIYSTFHDKN